MTVALTCLVSKNPILSHKTICGKLKGGIQIEKKTRKFSKKYKINVSFVFQFDEEENYMENIFL
jgi:hypothetical protein